MTNQITLSDGDLSILSNNYKSNNYLHNLGYCPQEIALFDSLTLLENINYFKEKHISNKRVDYLLMKFMLTNFKNTLVSKLSEGNKRKVNFIISYINNKPLLILDEPSTGMDLNGKQAVWQLINNKNNNTTVIISTHNMEEADNICDYLIFLKDGKLKMEGNTEKIKLNYSQGYYIDYDLNNNCEEMNQISESENNYLLSVEGAYEHIISKHEKETKELQLASILIILTEKGHLLKGIKVVSASKKRIKLLIKFEDEEKNELFRYLLKLEGHISKIYMNVKIRLDSLENNMIVKS